MRRPLRIGLWSLAALVAALLVGLALWRPTLVEVLFAGDSRALRDERQGPAPPLTERRTPLLIIAVDGVGRDLLYPMLRSGKMPHLAHMLGADGEGRFPHAHFVEGLVSTFPSSTAPAWATFFTGATPAEHGIPGDEFFVRQTQEFYAPVPLTVASPVPVSRVYADNLVGNLLRRPTVYERMRDSEPEIRIWVSMSQVYDGADRLLLGSRTVLAEAFAAFLDWGGAPAADFPVYRQLEEEVVETVVDELEDSPPPEVLTVYFPGVDFVGHHAEVDPERAQRHYLHTVVDPLLGKLSDALGQHQAMADRFVVVISDHGHLEWSYEPNRALEADPSEGPARVLGDVGFRVRPFEYEVEGTSFQAVLAYQGGATFIYLADRSACPRPGDACPWWRSPRFEDDVLEVAEAFHQANKARGPTR